MLRGCLVGSCTTHGLQTLGPPSPPIATKQVWEWVAARRRLLLRDDESAGGAARALERRVPFSTLEVEHRARAKDGTVKALFRPPTGTLEAVLMRYRDRRRSVCLSSQSGCPLTCTFCATGEMEFGRNLTASRSSTRRCTSAGSSRVDHVVFMGMGEPMLNLDAVLAAARRLPDIGVTHRRTTISTVGWLPGMTRFIDEVT